MRQLDADTERIELGIRAFIQNILASDVSQVPQHILLKVDERIARATKKNAALDADLYQTLAGKLEYFDLRELQDAIVGKSTWHKFESKLGTKEALLAKFDQLAELRNSIRHSRTVNEVVRMEGEAAILWFKHVLGK